MIPTDEKNDCTKMLTYFTNLYAMQKSYTKDCASQNGFKNSGNINITETPSSVTKNILNMTGNRMVRVTTTKKDEYTTSYNNYFEVLEESLADAKDYARNINSTATTTNYL